MVVWLAMQRREARVQGSGFGVQEELGARNSERGAIDCCSALRAPHSALAEP